jgi:hypothetical protein
MNDKKRCQSCGMPLDDEHPEYLGTEADGSRSPEYCKFCYAQGSFTDPHLTVDAMIDRSADFMSNNLGYARDEALELSNKVIRGLKRWS